MLQNNSESLIAWLKQQKQGNSQSWGAALTWGRLPLQGIKTLWELPSATLQLKQATKQHPAQFKLLRWLPPHTLSLSHTVEPVSFPVPHSSSFTVIEPRTELLSLAGYHRDPSLRTTVPLWGRRLATDSTRSKEERGSGQKKMGAGERSKWGRKRLQAVLYLIHWMFKYIRTKQAVSISLSFSRRNMEKQLLFPLLSFHQTHNCIHSAAC